MHVYLILAIASLTASGVTESSLHEYHVTYGRMAIEGEVAVCEIRFFKHDLETAVSRHSERPSFRLGADAVADSLFMTYLNSRLEIRLNGVLASATISGSGEEIVRGEEMWWYVVNYEATRPIATLDLQNRLLFEIFDDQRNMMKVQHFPSEKQTTFYFVADSDRRSLEFSAG